MAKKAAMTIEQELCAATGVKPKKKESLQDYYVRLHDAVQDLKDDQWDELSVAAQKWVNAAAAAVKKQDDVEGFPDAEEDEDTKVAATATDDDDDGEPERTARKGKEDDDEEDDDVASKSKGKAGKAGKAKPAKADKSAKAADKPEKTAKDRSTGPKSSGVKVDIKKAIIKKPTASVDDIMTALKKAGTKPSRPTVAGIRAEFRHSLAVLQSEGLLKGIEL